METWDSIQQVFDGVANMVRDGDKPDPDTEEELLASVITASGSAIVKIGMSLESIATSMETLANIGITTHG